MYPQSIDKFTEKLNKVDGSTYVIEEEVSITDGVYEGELEHDNVSNSSVRVYTGPKLTGNKIENFILSTPSVTPWKRTIKIFSSYSKVYITYETTGDTVEAEDINKVQESIVNTQKEIDRYKNVNDLEVSNLKNRTTLVENNKADKTYVDTELNKRYLKEQVFTKEEVLQKIQDVIGTAPEALDTLQEIAKALNNDADFAGTMTNELSKKVDKIVGKQLSTEDYTTVEKNKLAGIEQGANKYIHPSTHSADIIVENANKRFVSDTEKANWNTVSNKVDKVTGKGLSTNDFDNSYKGKLDGVATGSTKIENSSTNGNIKINGTETNVYTHPSGTNPHGTTKSDVGLSSVDNVKQATKTEFDTHTTDSVKHITAAERTAWNAKSDKTYVDTELAKKQNKLSYTPVNKAGDTVTGQLIIDGSAADRPLVVRGISGSSATGETPDTLYLNYDSDKPVNIGTTITINPTTKSINVNADSATKLRTARKINGVNFDGSSDITITANPNVHTHDDRYYTETEADSKFATKQELGNAGYGDMLASVYDKNNNGKVDAAEVADSVPWTGVTGKPSTFTPSSHTHTKSQITDFPTSLPANGGNATTATKLQTARTINGVSFDGSTNITITAAPNAHTHTIANVTGLQSALDGKMNTGPVTWNNLKGV
ncbi:hypothetical protein KQI86_19345 [Clostridium sp. MSJ-11]|uniref:EF-hand domain-containing protein n=1 Tax=Clostridium mobile TaxID=2841512 RepID=A0ABS6EQ04_9CLOT|nr:hypothetical protein [Clostridium mobile]MBU5486460.1 hypothetical protein [Clostridium mobile]